MENVERIRWVNFEQSTIEELKSDISVIMKHLSIKRQGPCRVCGKKWYIEGEDDIGYEMHCYSCDLSSMSLDDSSSTVVADNTSIVCGDRKCSTFCSSCGKRFCRYHAGCKTDRLQCNNCIRCSITCETHGNVCLDLVKCQWNGGTRLVCRMCPLCYPSSLLGKFGALPRNLCSFHIKKVGWEVEKNEK